MSEARHVAFHILERIEREAGFSHLTLAAELDRVDLDGRDRALVTQLVYGTLTWRRRIDDLLQRLVKKGTKSLKPELLQVLRLATYQIVWLDRVPDHAAVNEAVRLAKGEVGRWATGLVNGVLRNLIRQKSKLLASQQAGHGGRIADLGLRYSHPDELVQRMQSAYGDEQLEAVASAYSALPPLFIRALDERAKLGQSPHEGFEPVSSVPGAWQVDGMRDELRRELESGKCIVQDLGSQLIGHYCAARPGQRVVDACAGLGGKTLSLAIQVGHAGRVVAVEPYPSKIERLQATAKMAGWDAVIRPEQMEFERFSAEQRMKSDFEGFDLILVDAPCSGLGIIRRHPESKWRHPDRDVKALVTLQRSLLQAALPLLAPGGQLVYSVCTFVEEEGRGQVDAFLASHTDMVRIGPPQPAHHSEESSIQDWSPWIDAQGDLWLNPAQHGTDGFYAARLGKRESQKDFA